MGRRGIETAAARDLDFAELPARKNKLLWSPLNTLEGQIRNARSSPSISVRPAALAAASVESLQQAQRAAAATSACRLLGGTACTREVSAADPHGESSCLALLRAIGLPLLPQSHPAEGCATPLHRRRLGTAAALPPAAAAAGLAPTARAAAALADVAEGSDLLQFGGALGIALGGAFLALWTLERQAAARNAAEAEAARAEAAALKEEVARLQAELEAEKKVRSCCAYRWFLYACGHMCVLCVCMSVYTHARIHTQCMLWLRQAAGQLKLLVLAATCVVDLSPTTWRTPPSPGPQLREEAEGLQGRLSDASKNIMKLEKALEIKVGVCGEGGPGARAPSYTSAPAVTLPHEKTRRHPAHTGCHHPPSPPRHPHPGRPAGRVHGHRSPPDQESGGHGPAAAADAALALALRLWTARPGPSGRLPPRRRARRVGRREGRGGSRLAEGAATAAKPQSTGLIRLATLVFLLLKQHCHVLCSSLTSVAGAGPSPL